MAHIHKDMMSNHNLSGFCCFLSPFDLNFPRISPRMIGPLVCKVAHFPLSSTELWEEWGDYLIVVR